jgi:uncharacterized membrane protein
MNTQTGRALALLAAAGALGLSGEVLRVWVPARLDVALWVAAMLLTAYALIRAGALTAPPQAGWLAAGACVIFPCLLWRDSPTLFGLNLVAIGGLLVLAAPGTAMRSLDRLGASDLIRGGLWVGGSVLLGPIPVAIADIRWAELPVGARIRRLSAVAAGLVAAVPVLLLFGSLLSEADPLFGQSMAWFWAFDLWGFEEHIILAGLMAWAAAGGLRGGFWREGRLPGTPFVLNLRVPPATLLSFLGAIGGLFALFVGFQARELFLGPGEFQALTGTTIADYARRGFFELVAVTALTLPMLLAADSLLDRHDASELRQFRRLTAAVLVLLALVLASAYNRMLLYRSYYGLTEDRFYTLAFMTWLGVLLAWFAATVLRGRRSRFVPGALLTGLAALLLLNLVNPDAVVARVNLNRAVRGAPLDKVYLSRLSADAIPTIVNGAMKLEVAERCALVRQLETRWGAELVGSGPSSTWNLARLKAQRRVGPAWEAVRACAAPAEAQGTDARL